MNVCGFWRIGCVKYLSHLPSHSLSGNLSPPPLSYRIDASRDQTRPFRTQREPQVLHLGIGREESPDLLPELPYCPISTIHFSFTAYSHFSFQCVLLSKRVDARTRSMDSELVRYRDHTSVLPIFEPDQERCRIRSGPLGHSNSITTLPFCMA